MASRLPRPLSPVDTEATYRRLGAAMTGTLPIATLWAMLTETNRQLEEQARTSVSAMLSDSVKQLDNLSYGSPRTASPSERRVSRPPDRGAPPSPSSPPLRRYQRLADRVVARQTAASRRP